MAGRIDVSELEVSRGTFTLQVDELHIEEGEVFAILGATGSGKTVLMEAIAGAYPLNAGSILLDGKDIEGLPIQQRHLGILYQDYALFPHMTVRDNIAYGLKRQHMKAAVVEEKVNALLQLFGIERIAERYPGVISGGEAQRTALARALILQPEILILDEPFSALDPTTKLTLYNMLHTVQQQFECTIVFVTHDFNEAQTLADRVGIILDGCLRCVVQADRLFTTSHTEEVKRFLGIQDEEKQLSLQEC